MLLSPSIWWGLVAAGFAVAAAGAVVLLWGLRASKGGRRARRRLGVVGVLAIVAGAGGVGAMHAYGPWWRHAPTWVLIRAFPVYAPAEASDPVTDEIVYRLYEWLVGREDRVRLAAVCGEVIADGAYPWQTGVKAIEILRELHEEKRGATPAVLAGLGRAELRTPLLRRMTLISDMGPGVRRAMMGILADEGAQPADRCWAAWTLGAMGRDGAEAAGVLAAALDGPDAGAPGDSVARSAATALGRIGPAVMGGAGGGARGEEVLAGLDAAASDGSLAVATRYAARVAAMCVRGEAASDVRAHAMMLRSPDVEERRRAAVSLRWGYDLRDSGVAVPELVGALGDEDERVRRWAGSTLRALVRRDKRYGEMVAELAAAGGEVVRARVKGALEAKDGD